MERLSLRDNKAVIASHAGARQSHDYGFTQKEMGLSAKGGSKRFFLCVPAPGIINYGGKNVNNIKK
jgi:hypothetical protein